MIRDQRHIYGLDADADPQHVEAFWTDWGRRKGFPNRGMARDLARSDQTLPAYINLGRWCASCPGCNGGVAAWWGNPNGCCLDCGTVYAIEFPAELAEIEEALTSRPPKHRNWRPGMDVADLKVGNIKRGFPLKAAR